MFLVSVGLSNLYRKHGSNRYAPMPAGTFAPSPSTLMSTAPAPIPFSQNFSEAATLEPTPTSSLTSMEPGLPSTQPPPASLGPMPGMGYVAGATGIYVPVNHHWCYCKNVEGREIWYPFPMADNLALEDGLKEGMHISYDFNSFFARSEFCCPLITFANSLDPDQDGQNIGPDLDSNHLTL